MKSGTSERGRYIYCIPCDNFSYEPFFAFSPYLASPALELVLEVEGSSKSFAASHSQSSIVELEIPGMFD